MSKVIRHPRFIIKYDMDQGYMLVDNKLQITIYKSQMWLEVIDKFDALPNPDEHFEMKTS